MAPLSSSVASARNPGVNRHGTETAKGHSDVHRYCCVPLTSNLTWARAPGNVLPSTAETGLPKDPVANALQISTIDRSPLTELVGKLSPRNLGLVQSGIDVILGR